MTAQTAVGPRTAALAERDARYVSSALKIRYTPMAVAGGEGCRLTDVDGRSYLDFTSYWSLAHLGYGNPHVRAAVTRQLERTMFAGLNSAINEPAVDLAERLATTAPGDFAKKVWFGLAGSDASETAMRLVTMATGRPNLVSFVGSWHGTTAATMALSGHPAFAAAGGAPNVTKVPYPSPYRNPFGDGSGHVTDQCLGFLGDYLFATVCPPEKVAAVFVETVQADSGDVVPPPDFMPKLRALCDRHGILLVVDDIKAGLGRTGRMWSTEHSGVVPDLLLLGKSLGGGLPLSAVVGPAEVLDVGTGIALFTVVGNATGTAAGLATLEVIEREGIVARAAETGAYLRQCLGQALGDHPLVGDIRGLGMLLGVELVEDRASKRPNATAAAKVVYRAWELGLVLFYAGNWSNVLEVTPPLVMTRAEVDEGVAILEQAVRDVAAGKVGDEAIAAYAGW